MANIIVRRYEHFNRAMGKYITSKAQYENEMAKGGYIPFEKAEQLAEKARTEQHKNYDGISKKAMEVCQAAKDQADKKGSLKLSGRLVDGMKKCGVCFDMEKLPKHYRDVDVGGFDASD